MTSPLRHSSRLHNKGGFGAGLFPLHSPLLRESLLVSFPPLIDMLKFRGYSRLTSGLDSKLFGQTQGQKKRGPPRTPPAGGGGQPRVVRLGRPSVRPSGAALRSLTLRALEPKETQEAPMQAQTVLDGCFTDAEADVAPGETQGRHVRSRCRCSMCPAIHIK